MNRERLRVEVGLSYRAKPRLDGKAVSFLAAVTAVMSPDFRRCSGAAATDIIKLSGSRVLPLAATNIGAEK